MDWSSCTQGASQVATLACIPIVISNVVGWIIRFSMVITLFFIIIAGLSYTTSGGDQKKKDNAKRTLTYAILGLVVILLSFLIIRIISYITGVECINSFGFGC